MVYDTDFGVFILEKMERELSVFTMKRSKRKRMFLSIFVRDYE